MSEIPLFKSKKRKPLRQRSPSPDFPSETTSDPSSVQDALRLRRKRRVAPSRPDPEQQQLVVKDDEGRVKGIPDRFTHQTGFVADMDDKHMNAYIESRLRNAVPDDAPSADPPITTQTARVDTLPAKVVDQTTRHGKLVEVDLPQLEERQRKVKEPRRRRNRRGSDDIKRDQLVEAFLSENRLDVYEAPAQSTTSGPAADERLAEEFKRQYMDEMSLRRQKRRPAINQPKGAGQQQAASDDVLKGPKLGGSRNARSAVRDALLSKQIGEKKR